MQMLNIRTNSMCIRASERRGGELGKMERSIYATVFALRKTSPIPRRVCAHGGDGVFIFSCSKMFKISIVDSEKPQLFFVFGVFFFCAAQVYLYAFSYSLSFRLISWLKLLLLPRCCRDCLRRQYQDFIKT